jgi:hypothetical protein
MLTQPQELQIRVAAAAGLEMLQVARLADQV